MNGSISVAPQRASRSGFALPTVLIASVVMIIVLLVAIRTAVSVRVSLDIQYYEKLSQEAAESGLAMAKACIKQNNMEIGWVAGDPLRPNTNCLGVPRAGVNCSSPPKGNPQCFVISNDKFRTTFRVLAPRELENGRTVVVVEAATQLLRRTSHAVWKEYKEETSALLTADMDLIYY